jgi:hypothetical protein
MERPPLVAEAEWRDTGQVGAAYAHTYYPAFIDAPRSSCFITPINAKPIYIHLVRQLKALEITDFDNTLGEQERGIRVLPIIKKPIRGVRVDSVSVRARDAWGNEGIAFAPFTEIIIGWEFRGAWEPNDLSIFRQALRRLLFTYRYLSPDLRARLSPALKGELAAIRVGCCTYDDRRASTALDRIRDNEPLRWASEHYVGERLHFRSSWALQSIWQSRRKNN